MTSIDSDEERGVHVLIVGRVQGVGYRQWCAEAALTLGLTGWVRNLRSGEVEAVFTGSVQSVEAMIAAAHEGPDWASVSAVRVLGDAGIVEEGFEVLPTE